MKAKRFVAIGLLTAAAVALVGCAITFSKKNKQYKPKTMQANAEYQFTDYNDTNKTWTLTGETPVINPNSEYEIYTTTKNAYGFTKTNNTNINILLVARKIYNAYGEEQSIQKQMLSSITVNSQKVVRDIKIVHEATQVTTDENENLSYEFDYSITAIYVDDLTTTPVYTYFTITENELSIELIETEVPYTLETISINQTLGVLHATYENGYTSGAGNGYLDGYEEGYEAGEEYGYQTGYTTGYQTKGDLADGNFMDIRNMMLSVLTMPFTFINQAFDVTLWEGTAYEFNIGTFIKGVIAIASILFIIRLFTSGFALIGNYTNDARARKDTSNLRRSQTNLNKAKTRRENKLADKGK